MSAIRQLTPKVRLYELRSPSGEALPPWTAGANPLLVMLAGADWSFLVTPVLAGATTLVAVALLYHRCTGRRDYPRYWL
nr:HPP family protein [Chelatococcus sp. GW1]